MLRVSPPSFEPPCFSGLLGTLPALPASIQRLADQAFEQLKIGHQQPSLHFKKVGRFWSARVGLHHRAVGVENPEGILWFWIGMHAEYDKPIG